MSNDEFSSVEWLVEQIKKDINLRLRGFDIDKALEQAKAMHKEEIENSYDYMRCIGSFTNGKEYYNETFGGNNE